MRTQKFYSFNIQAGVVTAAFKYDDGMWKTNDLELGERYATDGENVFLVETEHGRSEITTFSLLPGQTNLYSKVGKSYVGDATSLPSFTYIDSVPSEKSQEGIETSESEAHSASHDEAHERTESHIDVSLVNASTLESASPLHEESHLTQHLEGIETNESEAHSALHDEVHERTESHSEIIQNGPQMDSMLTSNTIKLSHVLTSLKMYLGRLDASSIDPLAWVAVDVDNDGQLTLSDVMTALKGYLGKNQQAAAAVTATKYLSASDLRDVDGVKKLIASDGAHVDREHIHVRHWDKAEAELEHVELIGVSMEHLDSYIH